jgi:hypothetical protein
MTQADLAHLDDLTDIKKYFLGSVLSGGDSDPTEGNSLAAWTDTYDRCQEKALATRLAIPILYGVDAVHGHSNVLGAVMFPHNIGLGCTRNPELVEAIGRITAKEVRATGTQWAFAPCVTVPQDDRWGRTYEGFSEDPRVCGELFPRVGFIVTNLTWRSKRVVRFYNGRGTAEQWIKEGKNAVKWTKLSCRTFKDNQARLQLFALAYNLGNFLRRLALPKPVRHWSLTTLREKLIKIGAKVTRHSKYVTFQLAEVAVTRNLFAAILNRIARLAIPPPMVAGRAS